MFEKHQYRRVAGLAGALTQSDAVIKSAQSDIRHAPGLPVKLASGKIVALAGGEKPADVFGIVLRPTVPFTPFYAGDFIEIVHEGFIQVPMVAEEQPVRGGAVYFNTTSQKFTTTKVGNVQVRAIWACDGQQDGIAEVQIITHMPVEA